MEELEGRRALVTGGAQGLGRATAELLVARGARVMLADVDADAAEAAAEELGGGEVAHAVRCDVTSAEEVAGAVEAATEALGGLDTLVSNAGVEVAKPLVEHTEEEYDRLMAVNVKGVWLGTKLATPALAESGRGAIVNMASVAGIGGAPLLGVYCASKAAVIQLTRVAAVELRDSGIRVNAVCPSFVGGDMVARMVETFDDALPMSFDDVVAAKQARLGTAAEVAEMVAFLVSDDAAFVTGAHYVLDGGLTASGL